MTRAGPHRKWSSRWCSRSPFQKGDVAGHKGGENFSQGKETDRIHCADETVSASSNRLRTLTSLVWRSTLATGAIRGVVTDCVLIS